MNQLAPPMIDGLRHVRFLDAGGFASVHLYEELDPLREVAVKVINERGLTGAVRERFISEAAAMARLGNHPYIVQVLRVSETADGRLYLVMEYYPNSDLGKLAAANPFPVQRILEIGVQVSSAVETAHVAGILHRDIKPGNILTNEFDQPGLADFGIAGRTAASTIGGDILLSIPWSPPEALRPRDGHPPGIPAEIYSLGATLWQLLVGHSPFFVPGGDNSRVALEERILRGGPPSTGRAPQPLESLLRRTMAMNPMHRPESAVAFAKDLQAIQRALGFGETPLVLRSAPVTVVQRPPTPGSDLTATRMRRPAAVPIFEVVPPVRSRPDPPPRPAGPRLTDTVHRPQPVPEVAEPAPDRHRPLWPMVTAAAATIAAAAAVGIFLLSGNDNGSQPHSPDVVDPAAPEQNAGGDNAPPGRPAVTVARIDPQTLRFSWTYSAPQGTDTFAWRTPDGSRSGVAASPAVDISVTGPLCVQVKVVRADGSNGTADWSPAGCGA